MKEDCLFCKPNKLTQKAVIEEFEDFKVILDPFPINFGHKIIVPQRHVEKIDDLDSEELMQLQNRISNGKKQADNTEEIKDRYFEIMKTEKSERSEEMIKSVIGNEDAPEGFNIGINEGEAAGQTIDHLHIHVIPRYEGDVEDPKGGVRNVIPGKADYT
jgi:diadenosine tetraphosphate (Ap4A) HIT family hydrolase